MFCLLYGWYTWYPFIVGPPGFINIDLYGHFTRPRKFTLSVSFLYFMFNTFPAFPMLVYQCVKDNTSRHSINKLQILTYLTSWSLFMNSVNLFVDKFQHYGLFNAIGGYRWILGNLNYDIFCNRNPLSL